MTISRREVLKALTRGAVVGSVAGVVPLAIAERLHHNIETERTSNGKYKPKYFSEHQYRTLRSLCDSIIPADEHAGGALEAGAPEFIDLLTSENSDYQLKLGGGIMWLDALCIDRFGTNYIHSPADRQKEILDLIAYQKNAAADPGLSQGVAFFSFLRNLTADGYFTSKVGIEYLGYIGNTALSEFPGCPEVKGV